MEQTQTHAPGYIDIELKGAINGVELTPQHYDIRELRHVLECADRLFRSSPYRTTTEDLITLEIQEGSVVNRFAFAGLQRWLSVSAMVGHVGASYSLVGLERSASDALLGLLDESRRLGVAISIRSSAHSVTPLVITPETSFQVEEELWLDVEAYLYGTITRAGGKSKTKIQLDVDGLTHEISTTSDYLGGFGRNILYKRLGARVKGKQSTTTKELANLQLIELIDYTPTFDDDYIDQLIERAKPMFATQSGDEILQAIRPTYGTYH